ncbi:hypothetical protein [Streptomyces griseoaurantiacus]|uniref:hypothetical protein n=1 Tax=Streptomyces griseoaurantiacus TaxID=68213 RepID=UPI002E2D0CB4|nr:hypothetical protein [Streptomyces jietaisiensis]
MSSSVIIDWEQLAAAERDRCLALRQEFLEARAHARRLARRCAVARAVTGTRVGVPEVVTPGIEEGSTALAEQLDSVRERLAAVETQLEESARTYARERAAARPARGTAVPRPGATTTATDQLAAWRARENERQRALDDAVADRNRAEAAERAAAATLEQAAELARALPGRAEEVHAAARGVLAGEPGAQESFARLSAAARETARAERAREEATLLRERIALVTERVAAARHPAADTYADTLRARTDGCGEDPAALTAALRLAQEVLGRLTAAESRAELVAAVHEAMGEVWSLTDAPDGTAAVGGAAAARGDVAVLLPLPDAFPHHAVRFDVDGADALTAEVVRLPGGDPATDRAAQERMCGDMDELTERLAARGFATRWREQAPAGAFPAAAATAGDAAADGGRSTAGETARAEQERAAAISRARAAAPRQAASRPTGPEGGRR